MKVEQQIDCMITLLKTAKEELHYAENYKAMMNQEIEEFDVKRFPSGTLIRENLKTVSRLARMTSDMVTLTPYCNIIEKDYTHGRGR